MRDYKFRQRDFALGSPRRKKGKGKLLIALLIIVVGGLSYPLYQWYTQSKAIHRQATHTNSRIIPLEIPQAPQQAGSAAAPLAPQQ